MARPSEEFTLAWASLSGNEPAPGWRVISLPAAGPVAVQAGRRSPDDSEAILLDFPSARLAPTEKLPEGQGFAVERAEPDFPGMLRLALTRRAAGSTELFATMARDVVGALDEAASGGADEGKLLRIVLARVGAWQEFMRKGSQSLSPEAEIGLLGELTVLRAIVQAGVPPVIATESWTGPLDGVQDFELGTGAFEVKATLASVGFPAWIRSLEQLDDSTRQPLFVVAVRLRQTEAGESLPAIVRSMRAATEGDGEAARLLDERLLAAGYFDGHADRYVRQFALAGMRLIEVNDEFPRLTLGNVPAGIVSVTYEIDLDKTAGQSLTAADALKRLGVI